MSSFTKIISTIVLVSANMLLVQADTKKPNESRLTVPSTNTMQPSHNIRPSNNIKPSTTTPGAPIQSTTKFQLNPAYLPAIRILDPVTLKTVTEDCNFTTTQFTFTDLAMKKMDEVARSCRTQAYSQQDQQLAGCVSSDTLAQCQPKLYRYCMAHYRPVRSVLPNPTSDFDYNTMRSMAARSVVDTGKCLTVLTRFKTKLDAFLQIYPPM